MTTQNPKVDSILRHTQQWRDELETLRSILLECELTEELKWYQPCYTFQKKNVVLMHGFKEYCALLFFKGALLKDPERILVQQTENVQGPRQIRFTNVREIVKRKSILKAYVAEAIELEKSGAKVKLKKVSEFKVPEEFQKKLDETPTLRKAFFALTPGRQRGYLLHFAGAKQSKTRELRIERHIPQILEGKGLDD